ncbi:magnesium transporter [Rhodococcus sp. SMB37]|uniref:magnesium transporter CorA family protein n=1 Tax=Rhodococcus sp. SMB37 TaxID=2512213 RepID=UPI0006D26ABB|nr:magnesium transporter CorA family protein [Rhodococcus sp. SMB37]TCN54879.1 magnesium transporter [Rhodococcus sp. SMB37]
MASLPGGVRTRLWRDGVLVADGLPLDDIAEHLADERALVWVDLHEPGHAQLSALAAELEFDPHAVEDAVARSERTKATRYPTHTFVTVYATHLQRQSGRDTVESRLNTTRVSAFILPRGIVTVRRRGPFDIDEVTRRWADHADLMRFGTGALLHGLLDVIVDGQFETIQALDDAIEDIEDSLFGATPMSRETQHRIYRLRKEIVQLRRVVLPMREVVSAVMRHRAENGNHAELDGWYTDLYDHVIRATEWTESLRDMVTTLFETNLSLQDARLNTVMKKLTGWAAIIAVPTAVTGWYGMNVPYPGFDEPWGVLVSACIIVGSAGLLYLLFKRRDWL